MKYNEWLETMNNMTNDERVQWYHARLRETLNRSKHNGRIHVVYLLPYSDYVRAVVDVNGMAERWWFDIGRHWRRNMCASFPAVTMARSRAAKNPPWRGDFRGNR